MAENVFQAVVVEDKGWLVGVEGAGQKRKETCMLMELAQRKLEVDYCGVVQAIAAALQHVHFAVEVAFEAGAEFAEVEVEPEVEPEVEFEVGSEVEVGVDVGVEVDGGLQSMDFAAKADIDMADCEIALGHSGYWNISGREVAACSWVYCSRVVPAAREETVAFSFPFRQMLQA